MGGWGFWISEFASSWVEKAFWYGDLCLEDGTMYAVCSSDWPLSDGGQTGRTRTVGIEIEIRSRSVGTRGYSA